MVPYTSRTSPHARKWRVNRRNGPEGFHLTDMGEVRFVEGARREGRASI